MSSFTIWRGDGREDLCAPAYNVASAYLNKYAKSGIKNEEYAEHVISLLNKCEQIIASDNDNGKANVEALAEECLKILKNDKTDLLLQVFFSRGTGIDMETGKSVSLPNPNRSLFCAMGRCLLVKNDFSYIEFLLKRIGNIKNKDLICDLMDVFLDRSDFLYGIRTQDVDTLVKFTSNNDAQDSLKARAILEKMLCMKNSDWGKWWSEKKSSFSLSQHLFAIIFDEKSDLMSRREAIRNYFNSRGILEDDKRRQVLMEYIYDAKNNQLIRMDIALNLVSFIEKAEISRLVRTLYSEEGMQIVALAIISSFEFYEDPELAKQITDSLSTLKEKPKTYLGYAVRALARMYIKEPKKMAGIMLGLLDGKRSISGDDSNIIIEKLGELTGKTHGADVNAWRKEIEAMPEDE